MDQPIYLDHNATTPIHPEVREAMLPWLGELWGNPSSAHAYGRRAAEAVAHARMQVAQLIGAQADEIIFTSGGTEA
ncbi:MAG: aminotransferase class V-fold PLP-dependent enzyme, partial [Nannocystaceae bacterium]